MKTIINAALMLTLLNGCSQLQTAQNPQQLSSDDRQSAEKDKRGHPPRPMTQERLDHVLKKYSVENDKQLFWSVFNDKRRQQFDRTDTNNNDIVDAEEYVYEFEGRLDDGLEEARKGQVKQTARRFSALDKDDSNIISWEEFEQAGTRTFSWWDTNKDGVINDDDSKPDYRDSDKRNYSQKDKSYAKKHDDKHQKNKEHKHDGKHKKSKSRMSWISMPTTHSKKGMLSLFDANEDSEITTQEFVTERRAQFHLADQDNSGELIESEYLSEYEDRLDTAIDKSRRGAIKQTYVRFNALDDDADQKMTFAEFQISGKRIFNRWDKDQDGVVSAADIGL